MNFHGFQIEGNLPAMTALMLEHYTQYGEQDEILNSLKDEGIGRYLDIGAWHPTKLSNTRALYEIGWSGVLIEPSPGPLQNLIREYGNDPRISIIGAALGANHSVIRMHASDDAYSTSSDESFEKWRKEGGFYGDFFVPQLTIADILNQFGAFQFVSIDAEGESVGILKQLLDTPLHPKCICVEHDDRIQEIQAMAQQQGYKTVYTSDNLVLVR